MLRHERVRDRERIGRYRYVPMLSRPDGLRSHPVPVDADHDIPGSWLRSVFSQPFYNNGRVQNRRQMKHAVGDADTSYANHQYPFILFPAEKLVSNLYIKLLTINKMKENTKNQISK